jgi:hypothetical protein
MKIHHRIRAIAAVAAAVVTFAPLAGASTLATPPPAALETINPIELRMHLEFLTSPEVGGRYTLSPGLKIAARYLATRLESYGYRGAMPDGSFLQPYEVVKNKVKAAGSKLSLTVEGATSDFGYGDFATLSPVDGTASGDIVFVGYGVSAPDQGYDDYAKVDVKGKLVLAAPGVPKGVDSSKLSPAQDGAGAAAAHGATGYLSLPPLQYAPFMTSPNFKSFVLDYEGISLDRKEAAIPGAILPPGPAAVALKPLGMSLENVYELVKTQGAMTPRAIPASAKLEIDVEKASETAYNVVAVLEGTDPKLKDEYVALSAHYDHLKTNAKGEYYPGADDDGSGTAAVLALARAFSIERAPRSVFVIFHSGEELGLLGSEYNADVAPAVPLSKIVVDLNIDMIGRSRPVDDKDPRDAELSDANTIYVIGSDKLSKELHALSEQTNADLSRMKLDYTYNDPNHPQRFYYRSDHWNYAKNGIPIIFYFSGVHRDYHQPSDTIEKIDFDKMTKVTRLVYATGWRIANLDHRLTVDKK